MEIVYFQIMILWELLSQQHKTVSIKQVTGVDMNLQNTSLRVNMMNLKPKANNKINYFLRQWKQMVLQVLCKV